MNDHWVPCRSRWGCRGLQRFEKIKINKIKAGLCRNVRWAVKRNWEKVAQYDQASVCIPKWVKQVQKDPWREGGGQSEEGQHRGYKTKVRRAKCLNNMRNRTATGSNTDSQEAGQNKDSRVHQLLKRGGGHYYQKDNVRNMAQSKGRGGRVGGGFNSPQIFAAGGQRRTGWGGGGSKGGRRWHRGPRQRQLLSSSFPQCLHPQVTLRKNDGENIHKSKTVFTDLVFTSPPSLGDRYVKDEDAKEEVQKKTNEKHKQ